MNNRQLHQSQLDAIVAAAKKRGMMEEQIRALVRQAQYENDSMYAVPSWNDPQMHALLTDIAQETGIRMDYRGTADYFDHTINADNYDPKDPKAFTNMINGSNGHYLRVAPYNPSAVQRWIGEAQRSNQPASYLNTQRNNYGLDKLDFANLPSAERYIDGYYGAFGQNVFSSLIGNSAQTIGKFVREIPGASYILGKNGSPAILGPIINMWRIQGTSDGV